MDHMLPEIPKEDFRKGSQVKILFIMLDASSSENTCESYHLNTKDSDVTNEFWNLVGMIKVELFVD